MKKKVIIPTRLKKDDIVSGYITGEGVCLFRVTEVMEDGVMIYRHNKFYKFDPSKLKKIKTRILI